MIEIQPIMFYGLGLLALLSASMVVISKNPVRAVLFLVLTFFATGSLWLMLEAEFLAITLVLVYVGAVMVLFLFVIMMLDIDAIVDKRSTLGYLILGGIVSLLLILSLIYGLKDIGFLMPAEHPVDYSNVSVMGEILYTDYLFPFEVAGVLLLVAIITAISLTFRGKKERKSQVVSQQINIDKKDRLSLVNMTMDTPP